MRMELTTSSPLRFSRAIPSFFDHLVAEEPHQHGRCRRVGSSGSLSGDLRSPSQSHFVRLPRCFFGQDQRGRRARAAARITGDFDAHSTMSEWSSAPQAFEPKLLDPSAQVRTASSQEQRRSSIANRTPFLHLAPSSRSHGHPTWCPRPLSFSLALPFESTRRLVLHRQFSSAMCCLHSFEDEEEGDPGVRLPWSLRTPWRTTTIG